MYLWILIAGGINSFIDACGIGAILVTAGLSAAIFSQGVYSPNI